ncbi:hypothetical protein POTOM_010687 [Populus tomentosa]|uniref:Uncharacterized protein n=1 Tax=Populus tomentosa TaxID=118781 RepID=A0A8X8A905_POPTO|nr:hypothetical protein POTOM_010687 [Populus tomentosa]
MATHRLSLPPNGLGTGECRISFRSKRYDGISSREFSDSEHLKYYVSPARDLPIFSHAVCGEEGNRSLIGEVKEKMISEATEILIAELRNRRLNRQMPLKKKQLEDQHRDTVSGAKSNDSRPQNLSDGAQTGASGRKNEICMGGKCRKLGAAALLEEIERKMGMERAVVGCKCMGKCTKGPNVRVFNCTFENEDMRVEDSIKPPLKLLCIGVGLKDVGIIGRHLLGNDGKDRNHA